MKTKIAVTLVTLSLLGCAFGPNPNLTRSFERVNVTEHNVSVPELNTVADAEIGQSIVSTAKRAAIPAIRLEKNVVHSGSNNGIDFTLTIPSGDLLEAGKDTFGTFYRSQAPTLKIEGLIGGFSPNAKGGIFVPNDKTKPTEVYFLSSSISKDEPFTFVHPEISYKPFTSEKFGKDSFKRELVYSGVSQSTVSILYREFQNDLARPAFSQELKYDLSQGKIIGYRGARFEIVRADNLSIQYRVLKHLD